MKSMAMILNGVIINIAAWDGSPWNPPGLDCPPIDITNLQVAVNGHPTSVGIGWTYDGTNFAPPVDNGS